MSGTERFIYIVDTMTFDKDGNMVDEAFFDDETNGGEDMYTSETFCAYHYFAEHRDELLKHCTKEDEQMQIQVRFYKKHEEVYNEQPYDDDICMVDHEGNLLGMF